ncbi:hypothetical protein E4U43_003197 [Claviceps pusilla]|uniref:Uncharacterized protein n=1 Tax=Claviceps pusilla TaxID=123648 RepID=A0A9P7SUR0_9HYPO|nr:hypothetical protein E4U43_003197 [Claviceps pusilla]
MYAEVGTRHGGRKARPADPHNLHQAVFIASDVSAGARKPADRAANTRQDANRAIVHTKCMKIGAWAAET